MGDRLARPILGLAAGVAGKRPEAEGVREHRDVHSDLPERPGPATRDKRADADGGREEVALAGTLPLIVVIEQYLLNV